MENVKEIVKDITSGKEPASKLHDALVSKIQDKLESKKIEVASKIYNNVSGE